MSTLRTAAQQALEALAIGQDAAHEVAQTYHEAMSGYRPARHIDVDDDVRKIEDAITALRAALTEPPTDWEAVAADQAMTIAMLRSEEPVAWMVYTLDGKSVCVTDNPADFTDEHRVLPLYTAPPQRKPPATIDEIFDRMNKAPKGVFYGHDPMTIWMEAWRAAEQHGIKDA